MSLNLFTTMAFSLTVLFAAEGTNEPSPIPNLDVVKYQGLWHQHATIPASFQNNCIGNATAEYKLLADETIEVINSCDEADDKRVTFEGRARVNDKYGLNSTLEVTFVNFAGTWIWQAAGDYWVIYLSPNQDLALIGHPTYEFGWILSRSDKLMPETYQIAHDELAKQGYDTCEFKMTDTPGMSFEKDITLCDYVKGLK